MFTASHQHYADVVIDILDPKKTIFSKRLFRNSCIHAENGLFIKDLRILNCDLKHVVIVDNAVFSFAFQLDNGVPIIPFYDDKEDAILPKITDYLLSLKDVEDVRAINRRTFSLSELYDLDVPRFIKYYYDDEEADGSRKGDSPFRKCVSSAKITKKEKDESVGIVIGQKAQEVVEHQLGKLRNSLPKYLANHEDEAKTDHGNSSNKYSS